MKHGLLIGSVGLNVAFLAWLSFLWIVPDPAADNSARNFTASWRIDPASEPRSALQEILQLDVDRSERVRILAAYLDATYVDPDPVKLDYRTDTAALQRENELRRYRRNDAVVSGLQELLGPSILDDPAVAHYARPLEHLYPFLSAGKQLELYRLQYLRHLNSAGRTAEAPQVADAEIDSQIRELLTPEEYLEYSLRSSPTAHYLRSLDFDYSEAEFKEIFRIVSAQSTGQPIPITLAAQQQIMEYLGDRRFREFHRTHDPLFGLLRAASQRFRFSEEQISSAYDVISSSEEQLRSIDRQGPVLSAEQRQSRQAIIDRRRKELEEILGEQGSRAIDRSLSSYRSSSVGIKMTRQ